MLICHAGYIDVHVWKRSKLPTDYNWPIILEFKSDRIVSVITTHDLMWSFLRSDSTRFNSTQLASRVQKCRWLRAKVGHVVGGSYCPIRQLLNNCRVPWWNEITIQLLLLRNYSQAYSLWKRQTAIGLSIFIMFFYKYAFVFCEQASQVYVCMYVYIYLCMHVCKYVSMYVCVYVCMYVCT